MPIVGPGEDERTGAPGLECSAYLQTDVPRLSFLAVTHAVEADLRQQQRLVAYDVMQSCDVVAESLPRLEEDVETGEVEERKLEVFGRRIVDIRDERVWVLGLRRRAETLDEALDCAGPMPPHDRRRNLVTDAEAQHGRMTCALGGLGADALDDAACGAPALEKGDVVLPGEPDHDSQPVVGGAGRAASAAETCICGRRRPRCWPWLGSRRLPASRRGIADRRCPVRTCRT